MEKDRSSHHTFGGSGTHPGDKAPPEGYKPPLADQESPFEFEGMSGHVCPTCHGKGEISGEAHAAWMKQIQDRNLSAPPLRPRYPSEVSREPHGN